MFTSAINYLKNSKLVTSIKEVVTKITDFISNLNRDFNNYKEWKDFNPIYCNHSYDKFEINYNRFEINVNEINKWK